MRDVIRDAHGRLFEQSDSSVPGGNRLEGARDVDIEGSLDSTRDARWLREVGATLGTG